MPTVCPVCGSDVEKVEGEEFLIYDCTEPDYDWFEKLNAPAESEAQ